MNIKLNGEDLSLGENISLFDFVLLKSNNTEPKGVAVALNETIVPKSKWKDTMINENDNVEIVHAVQGG
ncbi:MAG: sulfur carrier protein ThiS [Ignavibacteria bacterium]